MKNLTRFGLTQENINSIRGVILKYPNVQSIILYGSRAKGNFRPGSDIDLTLVGPSLNTADLLKIENGIDDLMLPYKVDLSLKHQIENTSLIEHIERIGVEFK